MAKSPAWSEAEVAELIRLHSLMYSAREMAALLQRPSRNSILGKLHRLGLSLAVSPAHAARRTSWTAEQVAVLRHMRRASRTVAEMAARLGSTSAAVRSKLSRLGEPVVGPRAPPRRVEPPPASEMPRHPPGAPVPFLEAGRDACRYPLWSGRPSLTERMVCGAAAEPGWSYCRRHHAMCHHRRLGL